MLTREEIVAVEGAEVTRRDLLDVLFLASALIAPLELYLVASFTLYDLLTIGLAFLIWA
jgi:uncharacterized membrane protein